MGKVVIVLFVLGLVIVAGVGLPESNELEILVAQLGVGLPVLIALGAFAVLATVIALGAAKQQRFS